jgi:hypothetical protein
VWQQAIGLLIGLKIRNGFGEHDLAGAVGTALRRGVGTTGRTCEDCRVKVASGAANSGAWRSLNPAGTQFDNVRVPVLVLVTFCLLRPSPPFSLGYHGKSSRLSSREAGFVV